MASFTATIESTGEVLEFGADTPEQLIESYKVLNEYAKALDGIKKKLQAEAMKHAGDRGYFEHNDYAVRVSSVQRMTYDKAVLREVLDEDTFDLMLEPAKTRVDTYIRENLEDLGDRAKQLRDSMIEAGKPYTVVKLERLTRDSN